MPLDAGWRCDNGWTWEHELLAAQVEVTSMWGRNNALLHGAKPHKLPKPLQIERPIPIRPRKVETDPQVIQQFFAARMK